jgi:hypothetical protein
MKTYGRAEEKLRSFFYLGRYSHFCQHIPTGPASYLIQEMQIVLSLGTGQLDYETAHLRVRTFQITTL